ncbi:hypothetical protein I79_019909 [Cricetulus griseus]|uniref:Uncharacterized protein n=1 Tax=Cricetulus griseus TaxID=10029 RepID=G3I8N4_CRIGR|nr:hypothetical protein I79_019909 [Cricetulus griseus]
MVVVREAPQQVKVEECGILRGQDPKTNVGSFWHMQDTVKKPEVGERDTCDYSLYRVSVSQHRLGSQNFFFFQTTHSLLMF